MPKYLSLLATFLVHASLFAQKTLPEYGKIDIEDLQLKACAFEPGAGALKLFDVQEIEFDPSDYSSKIRTERRVRIKIFNEKGYKYASIKIPYFSKKRVTKFKDLSGIIYNLDPSGKIIIQKLEKKDFFKEKAEDNVGVINFTFPNVKAGSVIEFQYTKIEKNIFQIEPWILQGNIPTAYIETNLITPSFSRIKQKITGIDSIDQKMERLKGDRTGRLYFKENIPSFQPEPFMSSYRDNLARVLFLLIPRSDFFIDALTSPKSMWKFAGVTLLDSKFFGGQITKQIPGTQNIIDSAKKIPLIADRINFIYQSVKQRAPEKPEQTLYPNELEDAWNNKNGNTAEINLILLNLLEKSGVTSFPLLISTRDHGKINQDFPSTGQLNGVDVVAIDSNKYYLMDASLKFQSCETPPLNVLNRQGLLLNPDNIEWVTISDDRSLLKQKMNVFAKIDENGMLKGSASTFFYDYAKSYLLDSTDDDEDENKFINKLPAGLKITSVSNENPKDDRAPVEQKLDFNYEIQKTDNFYFINPRFLISQKENPFIQEKRNTDIDFGCNQELSLMMQLEISSGYEIDHLPKNITVRAPDSTFFFKRMYSSDSTHIYCTQNFEIKRSVFDKEEYPGVLEFFNKVYPLMTEEIVLKKKK